MTRFSQKTTARMCWVDITAQVAAAIPAQAKAVLVYSPHTTAGVTINENADPDVPHDFFAKVTRSFPKEESYYRHGEGNSDSHILTSLVGNSAWVPIEDGKLVLGTWQAIYLCEFDGPRTRTVVLQFV